MSIKQSMRIIQAGRTWPGWTETQKEEILQAMAALDKQIPLQSSINSAPGKKMCPICGSEVEGRYCSNCGQRISH